MNELELIRLSATEMRRGLLAGEFSAVQLTKAHLAQIMSTNERFNHFITICEDVALNAANSADKIIAQKKQNSPALTGIPVAIKDMLVTEGIETTCASKMLKGFIPPYDCTAVAKLRSRGAVILGKTNLDEFAMGASNENSAFGPVRNPWDEERVSGGSSGGSAVSVALGSAPLALGTDTGGSIRQPAAFTGILGLRPTYGRVSRYGCVAFASSLDQIGAFARTIEDLALIMEAISGHDESDSTSMKVDVPNYVANLQASKDQGLKGLRVGVPKEYFISGTQSEVNEAVQAGLRILAKLGAELVDISLPNTELAVPVYYIINPAEASSNLARYDGVRYGHRTKSCGSLADMYKKTRQEGFGPEVKRRIMIGTYVLSAGYYDAYYLQAQKARTLIINDFKAAFANDCDIIATPTAPTTAFKIAEKCTSPLQMYLADIFTCPVNLAGLCGLSLPCGLDNNELPIGLQLIGAPFQESKLMCVAQELQRELAFDTSKRIRSRI
ncbi:MAG: Asp-tRNA(Asn)/Glu-tRNA(Gln) amidotransferase subunit GatA [Deltaproteobacteria bacterium]|nr:Asp-tRNA(Asn)/Glu-tRNA(Gln) amidotransferase subunit GatA [Deltaproteobacteria bacterium]